MGGIYIAQSDWIAIIVAAIVGFVVGMLWYSPFLLGNKWMKLMKLTKKDIDKSMKEGMAGTMIAAFVANVVMALILVVLMNSLVILSWDKAAFLGLMLWVGFVATTFLNGVLWENRPVQLYYINVGHYFFGIILMSLVIYWI